MIEIATENKLCHLFVDEFVNNLLVIEICFKYATDVTRQGFEDAKCINLFLFREIISQLYLLTSGHRYSRYQSERDKQVIGDRDAEVAEHICDCEQIVERHTLKSRVEHWVSDDLIRVAFQT